MNEMIWFAIQGQWPNAGDWITEGFLLYKPCDQCKIHSVPSPDFGQQTAAAECQRGYRGEAMFSTYSRHSREGALFVMHRSWRDHTSGHQL